MTPIALLSSSQNPLIKQWWQYIAYGATKKIFEVSANPDGVDQISQEFKKQKELVLNRHIVQQTNQRTATIYSEMGNNNYRNFNNRF